MAIPEPANKAFNMRKPRAPEFAPCRHWHYVGDVSIEHGGMFYDVGTYEQGYVDAVRVQPCADAGGPDNMFWIETLTVVIHNKIEHVFAGVGDTLAERQAHATLHDLPSTARIEHALVTCGWDTQLAEWDKLTLNQRMHAVVEASVSYGYYDQSDSILVMVGPKPNKTTSYAWSDSTAVIKLRANASLKRYARALCDKC